MLMKALVMLGLTFTTIAAPVDTMRVEHGLYVRSYSKSATWFNEPIGGTVPITVSITHFGVVEDFQVPNLPPSVHTVPVIFSQHSIAFGSYVHIDF